jgi:hypothetical protein
VVQAKGNYSSGPHAIFGSWLPSTVLYNVQTCMYSYVRSWPTMIYFDRLQTVRFSIVKETWSTAGCGNTDHRGLNARVLSWLPSCPDELEKRCRWACFALWWKLKRACHTQDWAKMLSCKLLKATVNCSCLCSLHFAMLITNAKPCQNCESNLCGMESTKRHCQAAEFMLHI